MVFFTQNEGEQPKPLPPGYYLILHLGEDAGPGPKEPRGSHPSREELGFTQGPLRSLSIL